ncbi:MAG: 2-hydroxyacyl-CoA dehydratase [Clostridiales bacterium]|nr:2-hydroxyacyl-CoA dehydratase [Clostridiales bacterium]
MSRVVKKFGELVGKNIEKNPKKSLRLLKAGYTASGIQMKYFSKHDLLPHQKYASVICNENVRYSLSKPDNSAVVNIFFPCELLHAMDIKPGFIEGMSVYLNGAGSERYFIDYAENMGISQSYCSYHKALIGAALSKVIPKPKFIMNTTFACDANIITFRTLAEFWNVPAFTVDTPNSDSNEAIEYLEDQLKKAAVFIEDMTQRRFDEDKLKEIIKRENRSVYLYKEFLKELSYKYIPNDVTSEMYKLFFTHILLGSKEAEKYFELLLTDAKNAKLSDKRIRILWCHTIPNWQKSIKEIINNERYQLLAIDMNDDALIDLDESMPFRSLARKLLYNHMRGSSNRRAEKLLQMAIALKADGIIYFNHWGCKKTLGSSGIVKKILEKNGIPVLILDGDGCDRQNINEGQMRTRLQAFMEMLEGKNNAVCLQICSDRNSSRL